jgi:Protein of unknown function (DUF2510)
MVAAFHVWCPLSQWSGVPADWPCPSASPEAHDGTGRGGVSLGLSALVTVVVVLFAVAVAVAVHDARRRHVHPGDAFWAALAALAAWAAVMVASSNDPETDMPFLWPLAIVLGAAAVCATPWRKGTRRFLVASAIAAPLVSEIILLVVNATEGLEEESLATMIPVALIASVTLYSVPAIVVWRLLANSPRSSVDRAPPGWYQVPGVPAQQRYWDGTQWTDAVAPLEPAEPEIGADH